MTTIDDLNDGQVRAIKAQAHARGDADIARVCDLALGGDYVARRQVLKEIHLAETGKRIPGGATIKEQRGQP